MHTKTWDGPVQHPLAVNVVWTGASLLGESLLQKQPSWWNCLAITTGLFLGFFQVASLSFRLSSSIGERAQWDLEDSHL